MQPVAGSGDPAERVAYATEFLLRHVLACQGAVRAMIAATITRAEFSPARPGLRFGLIDRALAPLRDTLAVTDPDTFSQLRRDLAVVVSAEALFTLTDLCGLTPDQAIASVTSTARTRCWPRCSPPCPPITPSGWPNGSRRCSAGPSSTARNMVAIRACCPSTWASA
jgi:hypothetical protein